MVQHVVLWNYASVWKPIAEAAGEAGSAARPPLLDPDPAMPEIVAYASLMRKVRSGAAPGWWATTGRIGHG